MRLATLAVAMALLVPLAAATLTDPVQDDAGSGGDAGDSMAEATLLGGRRAAGGGSAHGAHHGLAVLVDDPEDWYAFELRGDGPLALALHAKSATCDAPAAPVDLAPMTLRLVAPDGTVRVLEAPSPCGFHEKLAIEDAPAGLWHVGLRVGAPARGDGQAPSPFLAASSPIALAVDYDLVLSCDPRC